MAGRPPPSQKELEEAERKAVAALAQMPEPADVRASASFEQEAEQNAALEKLEERHNDQLANDKLIALMLAQEERHAKEHAELMAALKSLGFHEPRPEQKNPEPLPKPAPAVPLDAIITIYIAAGLAPHEQEPILVGVNGNQRWIPRGVYTQVSEAELEVLQNAVYEGQEYPVVNDTPLAQKARGADHFTLSEAVPYRRARYPIMVADRGQGMLAA